MNGKTDDRNQPFDELMARLTAEETRLAQARRDYSIVTRSRFHALRMLWFSIKRLLGFSDARDVYAVWSPGVSLALNVLPDHTAASGPALSDVERVLIESWKERVGARPAVDPPLVTVVIPVYNHRDVTVRCLQSIAQTWFESLVVQFVVVDDGSVDSSGDVLTRLPGVDYVRGARNEGFIRACNRGAAIARGKYVCFLNNDTVVRDGWLDALVSTAEDDARIGIVGSKLIYPDGRLQEAGSIIWRDGTGWNYGRLERADDPRFNFVRDVDYVSGAAMLVRAELFQELGGFSERYRPAYYEDADLCFAARERGYRVVYQPFSEVCHYESVSAGDETSSVKRFQEINRPKFRERWASVLEGHLANRHTNVHLGARRQRRGQTILVVDSYVPMHDREAGSLRLLYIVHILRQMGYTIVFLPDNYAGLQPYTRDLQQAGVEVLHHIEGGRSMEESLDAILPQIDLAWICRPDLFAKYEPLVRRNAATRVIYDTVDLQHVRVRREEELLGSNTTGWEDRRRLELLAAHAANATVVVTNEEKLELEQLAVANVFVVPTIHEVAVHHERSFDESSGLLFIGNYNHPPNVDAVAWLCDLVMPLVWERLPDVILTLAGSNPPDAITGRRHDRVRVTGYVPDVGPFFNAARIFVAPLRFGAGMKGKIGHALAYRLPTITTTVGTEGFELRDGESALVVPAEPQAFAEAIVSLYDDRALWQRLSNAGPAAIAGLTPDAVRHRLFDLFSSVTKAASNA